MAGSFKRNNPLSAAETGWVNVYLLGKRLNFVQ
jgi:hypothetical protein